MAKKEEIEQIEEEVIPIGEYYKKKVGITSDGKQFSVKIPKKVSETIELKKGDKFRFSLIPMEEGFDLKIELIKQ